MWKSSTEQEGESVKQSKYTDRNDNILREFPEKVGRWKLSTEQEGETKVDTLREQEGETIVGRRISMGILREICLHLPRFKKKNYVYTNKGTINWLVNSLFLMSYQLAPKFYIYDKGKNWCMPQQDLEAPCTLPIKWKTTTTLDISNKRKNMVLSIWDMII